MNNTQTITVTFTTDIANTEITDKVVRGIETMCNYVGLDVDVDGKHYDLFVDVTNDNGPIWGTEYDGEMNNE